MKITGIEVAVVWETGTTAHGATAHGDARTMGTTDNRQQTALVTVRTDESEAGYGEANANPFAVKTLIQRISVWLTHNA